MRITTILLLLLSGLPLASQTAPQIAPAPKASDPAAALQERLGTVSFPVSCQSATQPYFNRGVALLHDFWYSEAKIQFQQILKNDPHCGMAHWGIAMSSFHEIWGRPDADAMKLGWTELQAALQAVQSPNKSTERERAYVAALMPIYRPGDEDYQVRIDTHAAAMAKLYAQYPDDPNAGAFYALALLADEAPNDTSLAQEHKALAVLTPLFAKYRDNPGVVHYIIHACDNPAMASDGLAAADHYGEIAQAGPHAFHMPGHIYSRLGLWPQDIASQLGSIEAAKAANARGETGLMDEPHSYDFLIYAYLQSGQDTHAKAALEEAAGPLKMIASMPEMGAGHRTGMVPYFSAKLVAFHALEMRDWKSAAAMEPAPSSPPEVATMVYWVRVLADGRLHQPERASKDLARYDELTAEIKKGKFAYLADGTGPKIERNEMLAWTAFADGKQQEALNAMRSAADLQDKVGQGEVDIPAREMLADLLLEFNQPEQALAEYEVALKLSPNRFNGLYNAGRAAEAAGNKSRAQFYYAALLKITGNGQDSARPELAHATSFVNSPQSNGN